MARRRMHLFQLCVLLAATCLHAQGRQAPRGQVPELEHFTFHEATFASKALGREVSYGVFLPEGYDDHGDRTYPLVVWLHGMFEDDLRFAIRGGAKVLDRMRGAGEIPEMVVVTPDGGRTSFYVNGKKSGRYEDLIVQDLLAHLDKTYRIAKEHSQRVLMGVSMGGCGGLKIALRHPELFGVVAVHSAALFPPDPQKLAPRYKKALASWGKRLGLNRIFGEPMDMKIWRENNPLWLAAHAKPKDLAGLAIYFDCGSRDRYGFQEPNIQLDRLMTRRKIHHVWRLVPGGGHGWRSGYNREQLPHSLAFVARRLAQASGTAALKGLPGPGGSVKGSKKDQKSPDRSGGEAKTRETGRILDR